MKTSSTPDRAWKPIRSAAFIVLGTLVSAIGVWWIAHAIDPDRFSHALQSVEARWFLVAVAAIVLTIFTRLWRWAILLRPLTFRTPTLMQALLIGQLLNLVLPVRLGDVVRSALLSRAPGSSFARVLGSVVIEKAWDWLTLCAIVVVAIWVVPLPAWFIVPARVVGLIAGGVIVAFIVAAWLPPATLTRWLQKTDRALSRLPGRWHTFVISNLQRLLDSLIALRNRSAVAGAAFWSVVTWGLGITANYSVMRAYGVESWGAAMVLEVVLMVGVALPPSIAAIGIFEGLTILTLSAFNIPIELGLAIGVALHLIIFLPPLVVWGMLMLSRVFSASARGLSQGSP